jgi:hypothetical protein
MYHQDTTTPKELFGVLAAGAIMLMVVHARTAPRRRITWR